MRKFLLIFMSVLLVFTQLSSVNAELAPEPARWCTVTINQEGVGRPKGCTVCSLELILQNSTVLKEEYQLPAGVYASRTKEYREFDKECKDFYKGDEWIISKFADVANKLTKDYDPNGAKWANTWGIVGQKSNLSEYKGVNCLVGLGDKNFHDMSLAEVIAATKFVWLTGYFAVFCVSYGDSTDGQNGPDAYKANHATMLAGVTDTDIWLNDPANGWFRQYSTARTGSGKPYKLQYMICFTSTSVCPKDLSAVDVEFTETEEDILEDLGVDDKLLSKVMKGEYSEADLSKVAKLAELPIEFASFDSLELDEVKSLNEWKAQITEDIDDTFLVKLMRTIVMIFGILLTLWTIILVLAFWWDKENNILDFSVLRIVSFGRFIVSPDDTATWKLGKRRDSKGEPLTVNVNSILKIMVIGILLSGFIISGFIFKVIRGVIFYILEFLSSI